MKRLWPSFIILGLVLLLTGCNWPTTVGDVFIPAALQVTSDPKAEVFINGKSIGTTPITNKKLRAGTYTVSLQSETATWVEQVVLHSSTVTIIHRAIFGNGNQSTGYTASLEQGEGLAVIGSPADAAVSLDGVAIGSMPVYKPEISAGSHDVAVSAPGYRTQTLKIKVTDGLKLLLSVDLAKASAEQVPSPTPEAAASSSPSASPKTSPSPTPRPTATATTQTSADTLKVGATGTGWLRVRDQASTSGAELFKVNTGDLVTVLETANGWSRIRTEDGKEGWASSTYLVK